MSKRLERLSELEDKLDRAAMLGDSQLMSTISEKIHVLEAMNDTEYEAYTKVSKMYGGLSVKAFIPNT